MQQNLSVKENASLKKYHTWGINATARYLVEIRSISSLQDIIKYAKERFLSYEVIGRGSNILFRDDYYSGVIIINKMKEMHIEGEKIIVSSGVNLPLLARHTAKLGLSGLQSLVGIPGTVGGAVYMNAGTGVKEISNHLISVDILDEGGSIKTLAKEECDFSYRSSKFQETGDIILQATFLLEKSAHAHKELESHLIARLETQPIDKKNSGCIFKNPKEDSAGRLIDSCGLKGLKVGGAIVSKKHANFIDNIEDATFDDIMNLIDLVKKGVKNKIGVELEYEVRIL